MTRSRAIGRCSDLEQKAVLVAAEFVVQRVEQLLVEAILGLDVLMHGGEQARQIGLRGGGLLQAHDRHACSPRRRGPGIPAAGRAGAGSRAGPARASSRIAVADIQKLLRFLCQGAHLQVEIGLRGHGALWHLCFPSQIRAKEAENSLGNPPLDGARRSPSRPAQNSKTLPESYHSRIGRF